jgi:GntR family transcriptional regulator
VTGRGTDVSMTGVRARTFHQRQRARPQPANNSVRRTYDLLRWSLSDLEPDARLVEEDLVDTLSASRNTVRAVLRLLAEQGLVSRSPKVGTTVSSTVILPVNQVMTVPELPAGTPYTSHGRVLESAVIPAPTIVRARLRLAEGTKVLMIEGLVYFDGEPVCLSVSYIALDPGQPVEADVQVPDGLAFLEQRLQVSVGESTTTMGAVAADAQTAALMGLQPGVPLVWLEDLLRDVDGRARALCQYRFRSDRVAFTTSIHRRPIDAPTA